MSVLVVGVSHRRAPVAVLERLALDADSVGKLVRDVADADHVREATALATCNRVEVYAEVDRFHDSVEQVSRLLCERAGEQEPDVLRYLYVHYDDGAVAHLFQVAAGLDSMVVGEGQILGQTREALRLGQDLDTVGPVLNLLFQQALRVGKRAHAETELDRAAPSLVTVALDRAAEVVGSVSGKRVLLVGAGSMAGLAASTVARSGAADLAVANRTGSAAVRLAGKYGGRAVGLGEMEAELPEADLLICCTGASGVVVSRSLLARARQGATKPLAVIDLALPHDVDPAVAELPGVRLTDLARLAAEIGEEGDAADTAAVRGIVRQEVEAFLATRQAASVTPTLVALRTMAIGVVRAELDRLGARLPDLDAASRAEVELTVRRVADKLLHQPTVRVKELADQSGAVSYASALAELFSLDPEAVDAVTRAEEL